MRSQGVDGGTATVVLCAVCLGSYAAECTEEEHFEQDRMSYIYNLLNDEYDLHGEDITLYKITPETFASHYTFHKIVPRRDIYVFSLSALGIDREEYRRLKADEESNGHPLRIATMRCFADLVEYRSDYRRTTYAYKDQVREFYEGRI